MTGTVRVREVAPRLAFQAHRVPTARKVELVDRLIEAGVPAIEVSSFVRPDLVPGLADAAEVFAGVTRRHGVSLECCIGNRAGFDRAVAAGADAAWFMLSMDEAFSQQNIGRSVDQSIAALAAIREHADGSGVAIGTYVIGAFGGPTGPARDSGQLGAFLDRLVSVGVDRWIIADSFGYAGPLQVRHVFRDIAERASGTDVTLQIHDSRGMGLAGVAEFLAAGFSRVDGALAGSGAHPAMPGARVGGVCTEDLVQMLHLMDVVTGIDLESLIESANWLTALLGEPGGGFVRHSGPVPDGRPGSRPVGDLDWGATTG